MKKRKLPIPGKGKGKNKHDVKTLVPFHQFSRLHADLRMRIWKLVEPEPRTVELRYHTSTTNKRGTVEQIRCLTRAPSILHVCRESRRIAIKEKLYERAFAIGSRYVWVNFNIDMISVESMDSPWLQQYVPRIQRFRFESENDDGFFYFQSRRLRRFTSLAELHIVCLDGLFYWVDIAEDMLFPTENVFFMGRGPEYTPFYSRRQMLERYPSLQLEEYSDSEYRHIYDPRIKGSMSDPRAIKLLFGDTAEK
jgi:hypothetical protein